MHFADKWKAVVGAVALLAVAFNDSLVDSVVDLDETQSLVSKLITAVIGVYAIWRKSNVELDTVVYSLEDE